MLRVTYSHDIFSRQRYGGVSRYYVELIGGLLDMGIQVRVCAGYYLNEYLSKVTSPGVVLGEPLSKRTANRRWMGLGLWVRNEMVARRNVRESDGNVFHHTYYSPRRIPAGAPLVITVHDLIHEKRGLGAGRLNRLTSFAKAKSIRDAQRIIAVSESTKDDLMDIYGVPEEKIRVVYHGGVPSGWQDAQIAHSMDVDGQRYNKRALLFVGERGGYKNFSNFLTAYAQSDRLKRDFSVICFGGGIWTQKERSLISRLGVEGRVSVTGGSDEQLIRYYQSARLFVYPSLYEGFGIPVVEAMQLGCPVVCGRGGSLPEVGGEAAAYFDSKDVESIRLLLEEVLYDDQRLESMRAAGLEHSKVFNWRVTARSTLAVYEELL